MKNLEKQVANIMELNGTCEEVLDSINAVHGEKVAQAVYRIMQFDRGVSSIAMLMQGNKEKSMSAKVMLLIFERLFETGMDMFFDNLSALGKSEKEMEELTSTVSKLFDRQREVLTKTADRSGE